MVALLPYIEFEVRAAEAVSLDRLAGWTVVALGTRIWLTEEKGGRDIWLLPGDRHRIAGAGRVVVESWPRPGADADLPARDPPGAAGGNLWAALVPAEVQARHALRRPG
jgi:hypothetical protein